MSQSSFYPLECPNLTPKANRKPFLGIFFLSPMSGLEPRLFCEFLSKGLGEEGSWKRPPLIKAQAALIELVEAYFFAFKSSLIPALLVIYFGIVPLCHFPLDTNSVGGGGLLILGTLHEPEPQIATICPTFPVPSISGLVEQPKARVILRPCACFAPLQLV